MAEWKKMNYYSGGRWRIVFMYPRCKRMYERETRLCFGCYTPLESATNDPIKASSPSESYPRGTVSYF